MSENQQTTIASAFSKSWRACNRRRITCQLVQSCAPEPLATAAPLPPRSHAQKSPAKSNRLQLTGRCLGRGSASGSCRPVCRLAPRGRRPSSAWASPGSARLLGEAPGADEAQALVGRAGKLLTDIIEKGMGLKRSDVHRLQYPRCRPPGNRNAADRGRQLPRVSRRPAGDRPARVHLLPGTIAAHNLLNETTPIGKLRGRFLDYHGIKVLCTYHPAYVLRNPPAKKQVWEDIQILMKEMGLEVPKKS
jgi:DNA polymerase